MQCAIIATPITSRDLRPQRTLSYQLYGQCSAVLAHIWMTVRLLVTFIVTAEVSAGFRIQAIS